MHFLKNVLIIGDSIFSNFPESGELNSSSNFFLQALSAESNQIQNYFTSHFKRKRNHDM